jgi:hypothetical protein
MKKTKTEYETGITPPVTIKSMADYPEEFKWLGVKVIVRDLADLFIGKKIGHGISREVYECRLDKTLVVKIEIASHSFKNVREWEIWDEIKDTNAATYFAPCVAISPCGTILLQKRANAVPKHKYPKKVPYFWGDMKYANYGEYKGKFVCIDYAGTPISDRLTKARKVRAQWWE